jgi:AAA domain
MDDDLNRPNNNTAKPGNSKGDNTAKEAVEFLTQLRQPPWILIAINPDKPRDNITAVTAHNAKDACAFVSTHDGMSNLYYSVNPTKTALSKKPSKTDIARVEYLLGDLDPRKHEKPEDAKSRYLQQLNGTFEPKPTAIVDSGNGIQALWRLDQAIDLSCYPLTTDYEGKLRWGPEAEKIIADVEDRAKSLMERLGSKAGTQNIDRILRLPGTTNIPTKAKIEAGREKCPTKLLAFNGANYPLDVFVPGSPEDGRHHARQEHEDEGRGEPRAHEEGGGKLERIIREGESGEFDGDRSRAVWWAINEMLRRGYLTSTVVSTLLDHKNKISDHVYVQAQPRTYAERQVEEAKKKVKVTADPKDKPLPESQWLGENPATPPPQLIKGVFPQTGVATIGGQSGSGKSFIAIHLGVHFIPDCKQHLQRPLLNSPSAMRQK